VRSVTKCPACGRGPVGAEGHLDLFVLKMRGGLMQFHCRTCTSLWVRTAVDSSFRWTESTRELDAPVVPGRTGEGFVSR
jgi:hypothetical protein